MNTSAPPTPTERLEVIAKALATAASGAYPLWGTLIAIDRALPLLTTDQPDAWRDEATVLLEQIACSARELVPVLAREVSGRLSQDSVAIGLGSLSAALRYADASHFADRISFARILMCELSILIEKALLAERGHELMTDINAGWGLIAAPSPSAYVN